MAAQSYSSEYPSGIPIDDGIKRFFETFYAVTDVPDAHERYVEYFTPDAELVMGSTKASGRDEILKLRKALWTTVASRLHDPIKIFPFGPNSNEVMLYGTVAYGLKDGRKTQIDWAARAVLVTVNGAWKLKTYRVYLDPAAAANAK